MIRNFVNEIESSLLMGEWTGFTNTTYTVQFDKDTTEREDFLLMKGGLVFDGFQFFLMGKELDLNLTHDEWETLMDVYHKLESEYNVANPTEDVLELASRFGGISAGSRGKE